MLNFYDVLKLLYINNSQRKNNLLPTFISLAKPANSFQF